MKNLIGIEKLYLLSVGAAEKEYSVIEKLTNLKVLYLSNNKLKNIDFIENLITLENIYLNKNLIEDLSPLSKLENLEGLEIHANNIKNIVPLINLPNIRFFNIRDNPLGSTIKKTEKNCPTDAKSKEIVEWCNENH